MAILALVVTSFLAGEPARADVCTGYCRERLVQVGLQGRVVQLVADDDGTCALTESGEVYCWSAGYPAPDPFSRNPWVLVTMGALLVAGGTSLLLLSRK